MDELVVVVEEDGGAVERGESNGRDPNLNVVDGDLISIVDGDQVSVVDGDLISIVNVDDQ